MATKTMNKDNAGRTSAGFQPLPGHILDIGPDLRCAIPAFSRAENCEAKSLDLNHFVLRGLRQVLKAGSDGDFLVKR
jgi:hypothetical protein